MIFDYIIVLAAAMTAVGVEVLYRSHEGTWGQLFPIVLLPVIFVTFGIWKVMKLDDTLLGAIILFNLITAGTRLFSTYYILGERPGAGTLFAFGMIVCAHLISKFWR